MGPFGIERRLGNVP